MRATDATQVIHPSQPHMPSDESSQLAAFQDLIAIKVGPLGELAPALDWTQAAVHVKRNTQQAKCVQIELQLVVHDPWPVVE